jgi:DNA-binding NarL/FixJ family response regulator
MLLADDHPLMRDGVVHSLQVQNRLAGGSPGRQLRAGRGPGAQDVQPDVALIDLSMPGVGGIEVVRLIASRSARTPCRGAHRQQRQ